MSLVSQKVIDENKVELVISVEKEAFEAGINATYKKECKKINVPGFRKGKAPRSIIEKMYGKEVFFEGAIDATLPTAYSNAVEEAGIDPVSGPEFVDFPEVSVDGYKAVANVYVKPEFTLEGYKGLKATKTVLEVTDEDVDAEIERLRERNARMIDVTEGAIENGDTAVFDFDGYVDGVAFEGGKAEKFSLVIGSGQFIPGFEDQMVGHSIGEEFDVNVTFPENYHVDDLKGKPAVFKIKVHEIKKKELPELDDEFVKDVSEFDTLDELKADSRKKLEETREHYASEAVENDLIDQVAALVTVNFPACMVENTIDQKINEFGSRLSSQGLDLNTYLKYTGMDNENFRETFREQAEKQVKMTLALEKIVKQEGIEATEEEINAQLEKIAKSYGMEVDTIKPLIPAESLAEDVKMNKAIDLVRDNAQITEEIRKKGEKAE